ncbi:SAM-dependent methyltransferase [Actinomadura mexicana]|uniref:DNA-binding transcriptional activator of the SARP family n=1 Tax=Actinomadura mexicana TaxID=134959 RepID=A0A238X1G4_9ACTN|nr:SAM-dependent methyltransferase [Actinomadura mexicana]SNR52582.1 DNA-binding transcriptional activator of the SARP family [Actinomadura mexicana]
MEFRILRRRLGIRAGSGESIAVPHPHARGLLVVLLLEEGRPVPADVLVERLAAPSGEADPAATLTRAVGAARLSLPPGRLVTEHGGYRLVLDEDDDLDLSRFRVLAARARRLRASDAAAAMAGYERALGLWGGEPLGDLPAGAMDATRRALVAERGQVREELAEVRLSQGRHLELIGPARGWVVQEPSNEHLRGLLMLALHRAGRKREALRLYEEAENLPAPPGPALRRTAGQIGRDDPGLEYRPRPVLVPLPADRAADLSIDTLQASPARIYDYYLGGKDNYAVDRAAAEEVMKTVPDAPAAARANRDFLTRAVRYLAAQAGIRQFLDVGTGLPTQGNVHEIARDAAPDARVVYVDNDPVVLAHGRALLEGSPCVAVVEGDLRRPEELLADPRLNELIDLGEPVGLLLVAVLHFVHDDDDPAGLVGRLAGRLPSGSHVVISHGYDGGMDPGDTEHSQAVYRRSKLPIYSRGPEEVARCLTGLEILDPGIVWVPRWDRPHPARPARDPEWSHFIGAVARKP